MTFADSTQAFYARGDAASLQRLLQHADDRAERLLCLYRLYPLTEDESYLNVPSSMEDGTAREFALMAGLWGYRASAASTFGVITAGRRSTHFLKEAKARNPEDPFVLLVDAQSLLFRPSLFGGNDKEALQQLQTLRPLVKESPTCGISIYEADQWIWYALKEVGRSNQAAELRRSILAKDPPSLYRKFLQSSNLP